MTETTPPESTTTPTFADLPAHPALQQALASKGYLQPTPVQQAVIAPELAGQDLLVSAETGSGKTVAFGLALAPTLLGDRTQFEGAKKPLALVIAPTRELALQVARELSWLYGTAGARVATCVGGMDMSQERRALAQGAHIVVGTPGRLVDHLERKSLSLESLRALVLDEADEMLDMGFRDELERILSQAPVERRTLLFSATIPEGIDQLAKRYQKEARRVQATPLRQQHKDITYRAHLIAVREREHAVVNVLRASEPGGAIVFVATRDAVNHLTANLAERGFGAVALSGELTQAERSRALKALRDGRAHVLVATDVAARGLDLPAVSLVVHADLPHDAAVLQHRSGRTGRAGKKGAAVLLVPNAKRRAADRLLREARIRPIWSPPPSGDEIRKADDERIVQEIGQIPSDIGEQDLAVARRLLSDRTPEQLAGMLVAIHRARLPAAEELPLSQDMNVQQTQVERRPTRPERPPMRQFMRSFDQDIEHGEHPAVARPTEQHPSEPGRAQNPWERPSDRRPERPAPGPRGMQGGVWFTLNVGRSTKADPKWLIPLICRRGNVTKQDIGAIKIFAEETRIEISAQAAERFAQSVRRPDKQDPRIRFTPSAPPAAPRRPPRRGD